MGKRHIKIGSNAFISGGIKMHTKSKKEYDLYWQAIRGLAILAVVLIHCKSNIQWPIISFGGVLSSC